MKIIKLVSENVKRLSAVEITPDGTLVTVGGKNGAGKSSVLDSIAYALGGKELIPAEPIRSGQSDAKIVVDLGDFTVTRRFYREKFACNCANFDGPHSQECHSRLLGETKSTLAVTTTDGAKFPSPQKMLDAVLGQLTFDPLAFSREESKKQNEILRQITSLDFSMLDTQRKAAYDRRAMNNKSFAILNSRISGMTEHTGVPAEPISIDEISVEMKKGQELQKRAEEAKKAVDGVQVRIEALQRQAVSLETSIQEQERHLALAREALQDVQVNIEGVTKEAEARVSTWEEARRVVPDFETLEKRLREIDDTNTKVRANQERAKQQKAAEDLKKLADADSALIENVDKQKASMLEAAKFPVDGLGLSDDGVTFNDIPLEQASASEQLRVSIAIGLALNPKLKVLLIRNGNLLDEDSLKLVSDMAHEARAQVWMEFVTSNGEGMTVMMEDGHVA